MWFLRFKTRLYLLRITTLMYYEWSLRRWFLDRYQIRPMIHHHLIAWNQSGVLFDFQKIFASKLLNERTQWNRLTSQSKRPKYRIIIINHFDRVTSKHDEVFSSNCTVTCGDWFIGGALRRREKPTDDRFVEGAQDVAFALRRQVGDAGRSGRRRRRSLGRSSSAWVRAQGAQTASFLRVDHQVAAFHIEWSSKTIRDHSKSLKRTLRPALEYFLGKCPQNIRSKLFPITSRFGPAWNCSEANSVTLDHF